MNIPQIPGHESWEHLVEHTPESIAKAAGRQACPRWFGKFYAALWKRFDASRRDSFDTPTTMFTADPRDLPSSWMPILAAGVGQCESTFGLLEIRTGTLDDPLSNIIGEDSVEALRDIHEGVETCLRPLLPRIPTWHIKPHFKAGIRPEGTSLALPAAALALSYHLGLKIPRYVCATGGWNSDAREFVAAEHLGKKQRIARDWGYRELWVPDSREDPPEDEYVQIQKVPRDISGLLHYLFTQCDIDDSNIDLAATAMALYAMNTGCSDRNRVKHLTTPFADHTIPQLQQMAHELLGRAALHQGLTTNATDHFSRSDAAASRCPSAPATPSLMNQFVRFEIPTQRSIAWLDQGHLGEHPSHEKLDDLIGHLDSSPAPLDEHEAFLLLIMKNTQARRLEYLGRHNGCKDLVQQSWGEVTRFHDLWGHLICSYAIEELERRDTTMARQQNQVVDVLASSCMFDDEGHLTRDGLRGCEPRPTMLALINDSPYQWQATSPSPDPKWDMFDLLAWLKFHWATGSRVAPDAVRHGSISAIEYATSGRNENSYPVTSVFEWLMRPEYEGQVDQQEIGCLLANSALFKPQDDEPSVFRLLALRAARHLDLHAIKHPEVTLPHSHEALSVYFDKLQEDPTTVIPRCPY